MLRTLDCPGDPHAGLIDAIYDAAGDETLWDTALAALADAFGGTSSILVGHSEQDWDAPRFAHFGRLERQFNLRATNATCPYLPFLGRLRPGAIASADQFMPFEQRRATSWEREIMAPQDCDHSLMSVLVKGQGALGVFFLSRRARAGAFTAADTTRLAGLMPHLRRAAQIRCRLNAYGALASRGRELLDTIAAGIVLIDEAGAARPANRAAVDAIAAGHALRLDGTRLSLRRGAGPHTLEGLIASASRGGAGGSLAVQGPGDDAAPSLIQVVPLRGRICDGPNLAGKARQAVAVFITEMAAEPAALDGALADYYRLTPGEARVAGMLASGHGVPKAAGLLRLSENTVKMHAKRIYGKLGVTSQAQLVQVLSRARPPAMPRAA